MSIIIWSLLLPFVVVIGKVIHVKDFDVEINDGVLENIVQLRASNELNIPNLKIRAIKQSAFRNVNVHRLNLERNKLSVLPEKIFSDLKNLEYLSLGLNEINTMKNAFDGLEKLKMLNLSHNPINSLNEFELHGVPKSSKILTKGNVFKNISSRVFEDSTWSTAMLQDEAEESYVEELDEDETGYMRSKRLALFKRSIGKFPLRKETEVHVCVNEGVLEYVKAPNGSYVPPLVCTKYVIKLDPHNVDLNLTNLNIKTFRKGWYQLQNIVILKIDLSRNKISKITTEMFNDLPSYVSSVTLDGNIITTIKSNVIENMSLKELHLRDNLIENIENDAFSQTKLDVLYLSRNKLVNIDFVSTLPDTMTELVINRNQIQNIPNGIFEKLAKLYYLNIAGNEITGIKSNAFQGLVNLHYLILSTNKISKIEPGSLTSLKSLETLYLKENLISNCEKGTFAHAIKLKDITLNHNKFTKITKDTFADVPRSLERLNLGMNKISSLEEGSFVGVPTKMLYLNDNLITSILPGTFDINNLQDLFLNKNSIETISQNVFEGLPGLLRLWLSSNRISEIEKGSARNFGSLTTLDISKNPLNRLISGAFYGISKNESRFVLVEDNQIEMIEGGLFDDV